MVRRTDPHWKYAEKLDNNGFKCKFCDAVYAGGVSRIKFHLSNIGGRGIKLCPKVPRDVQRVVTKEVEGSNRKRKALSSSFNDEDNNNTDPTSSQNQNNEVRIQVKGDEDGDPMEAHNTEQQVVEGNHMDNNIGESVQYVDDEIMEVHNTEQQVEEGNQIDNNIREPVQSVETRGIEFLTTKSMGGESMQSVETRGKSLLSLKLVGEVFRENLDQIWAWLVNGGVSSIGIYGMAGVGKTELTKHINNKLLKDSNPFHHVYWFDVPQNFTICELQNAIAKKVGLCLSDKIGQIEKAAELSEALRNGNSILILDNVWNDIDLVKAGIPVCKNGCKLLITTRSFDVCRMIGCQKTIKVKCLDYGEDWDLFKEIIGGYQTTLSVEVEEIARDVVRECEGLPLALVTMARRMRGVDDIYQWRNALDKLKGPTAMQDNMDVFRELKLSYDHLNNSVMKRCFMYCALFPKYTIGDFDREKLIEYLIVEGIIERKRTRRQEIDEGHSLLNTLENVCLLQEIDEGVKMHEWIRKMALQIQGPGAMLKTYMDLEEELLDEKSWTVSLLRVLVLHTGIEEIPSELSPNCPNLSTLLLFKNTFLKLIPDSFFERLSGLKVLDLSDTRVETLPGSLFNLIHLVALLLTDCCQLRHVPSLANLRELEKLDMSNSGVEEVPEGIELLSKLRYLDLSGTEFREFPAGILPNLLRLQFLKLDTSVLLSKVELSCLSKLETLQCGLDNYGSDLWLPLLNKYNILIGLQEAKLRNWYKHGIYFPCNVKKLVVEKWDVTSLCDLFSNFISVEVLQLESSKNLQVLLRRPSAHSSLFLKEIKINNCSSIKNLFTPLLVSNLTNLEEIRVTDCSQMEEVIAAAEHEDEVTAVDAIANVEITLPKLRTLYLKNLKELKSICSGKFICDSIQYITVVDCAKLKRMSLSLSLTDNMQPSPPPLLRQIYVYPNGWWDSLDWDHPDAKNVLKPFVKFCHLYFDFPLF